MKNKKKKIVILATGGTIAAIGKEGATNNYVSGKISVQNLIGDIHGIYDLADLSGIQICNIPSTDVSFTHWFELMKTINELALKDDVDGFVITHGTDTLEETAYFLNLTVKTDKPVIITGSMRPSTAISPDGPMNLYQAVALAVNQVAIGKGVLVVFSDGIYAARDVQKINTFKTDAFHQKDFGCIGYMLHDKPIIYYNTTRKHTIKTEFKFDKEHQMPKVSIVYSHVDADPDILYDIAKKSEGLILAGVGAGWYSTAWIEKSKEIEELGIPVVRTSRIANGFVRNVDCLNCCPNIISGDNLPPSKARILLQLAILSNASFEKIQQLFAEY